VTELKKTNKIKCTE